MVKYLDRRDANDGNWNLNVDVLIKYVELDLDEICYRKYQRMLKEFY